MAVGAIRALAERGIEVPREVSVTGFDDTEDSRFSVPPSRPSASPRSSSDAWRSCTSPRGSASAPSPRRPSRPSLSSSGSPAAAPTTPGPRSAQSTRIRAVPAGRRRHWPPDAARRAFCRGQPRHPRGPEPLAPPPPGLRPGPSARRALLAIAEGECRFLASQRFAAERRVSVFGDIEASLVSSFTLEHILGQIARGTPRARHHRLLAQPLRVQGHVARVVQAPPRIGLQGDEDSRPLRPPVQDAPSSSPEACRAARAPTSASLCASATTGSATSLCTADSTERRMYEALRDQVSSALKGAILMAAERDRERSLERAVRARTLELSMANSRLVEEMAQRKGLERELLEISNRHRREDRPGHPRQPLPGHRRPRDHGRRPRGQPAPRRHPAEGPTRPRRSRGPPARRPRAPRASPAASTPPSSRLRGIVCAIERLADSARRARRRGRSSSKSPRASRFATPRRRSTCTGSCRRR